jgi:hypothetical protein
MYRIVWFCCSVVSPAVLMMGCTGVPQQSQASQTAISVTPSSTMSGSDNTDIIVSGFNFPSSATVLVNGQSHGTTYLNERQLKAVLTRSDLAQPKTLQISVAMPAANASTVDSGPIATNAVGAVNFTVMPAELKISAQAMPNGVVQSKYSSTLIASGGLEPYKWGIVSGRLPDGLSLNSASGQISGTPSRAENSAFSVQVAGSSASEIDVQQLNITIMAASNPPSVGGSNPPSTTGSNPPTTTGSKPPSQQEPTPTGDAAQPRVYIDTSMPTQTGLIIRVPSGGDIQGALNGASCGDTIELAAGASYVGNFVLPAKNCVGWIVIRPVGSDSVLPAAGARISPSYAHALPKFVSHNSLPAMSVEFGAHHYRVVGLEITTSVPDSYSEQYGLVDLGEPGTSSSGARKAAELPHDIVLDRCYIHGTPRGSVKRGVTLNGASLAVIDSYISDIHVQGQDTQAIAGWNGPGPFKIVNNELEASGENIMFGGARPTLVNNIPSDIEIRGNHFFKPLSWMVGNPHYAGIHWSIKNLLELKNAQRVLITGNIMENNWLDGQTGFGFLVAPRTELGSAPWVYVQDITFTYNILRHSASGIKIAGIDDGDPNKLVRGRRILIQNNLFEDINGKTWGGGDGKLFQILSGSSDVTIDHNTGFQSNQIVYADGDPSTNFVFQNNIIPHNMYGVKGSGTASGFSELNRHFPKAIFQKNVIENIASSGVPPANYPGANFFPSNWAAVQFVSFQTGNYALASTSPYKDAGTDQKDIGADIAGLNAATAPAIVP